MLERQQRFDQTALMAELIEWRTWSFRITLGGTRYVSYEQQTYTMSPNTIMWHAPLKQPLRLRWVPGTGSDMVAVSFTSQRWRELLEQYPTLAQRAQALLAADQAPLAQQSAPPQLLHVLRQVIALGASQRPGALALDNHCALLLNLLAEMRFDAPAPCQEHERRRVETAQAWMIDQMAKRPSLGEIAEALCVSPRQLQRDFLACAGMTPMRYLALMRLSEANFLLAETSLPIAEIATLLGYTSPAHFSAAFRQLYQCSPRQVREIFLY
jgi:AraC-like DNA-binding protein